MSECAVTGIRDGVDAILDQWHHERPDLPTGPLRVVTRLARVRVPHLVMLRCAGRPYRMGQARLRQILGLTSRTVSTVSTVSLRLARQEERAEATVHLSPARGAA